jgi:hypothetical protein
MEQNYSHLSDEELLLELDGEASPGASRRIQAHLAACWECRSRRHNLESAITEFTRFHLREFGSDLPPSEGPPALLQSQIARPSADEANGSFWLGLLRRRGLSLAAAGLGIVLAAVLLIEIVLQKPAAAAVVSAPDARLTPGATVLADKQTICRFANVKNKAVPAALRKKVFEEYGIRGAQPKFYEVDYLVTPALGGADDIRNLWPHSYSAVWNAKVKDDLEDHLRDMVCSGELDLTQAQRDIATDWIAAYKKYFHTDQPLSKGPQPAKSK